MKRIVMGMVLLAVLACKEKVKKAEYQGEDILEKVSIDRDKNSKTASLKIDLPGNWRLYSGSSVEEIDFSKPVLTGEKEGRYKIPVDNTTRSYFQVETEKGKAILAETHLPMAGGYNFRDLGGIRNTQGKYVKWGKFLRSDDLNHLTDEDLAYLSSVPLNSIVDFRSPAEMEQAPDRHPSSLQNNYPLNIMPGNLGGITPESLQKSNASELMQQMNVLMVTDSSAIRQYRRFFEILQDDTKVPVLFHCSAGKDRTGMGAALILYALGVDDETIMENYLLSNTYLSGKYQHIIEAYPHLEDLMVVKPEYLQAGIDRIRQDHGTVENYLENVLHVDIARFRERYLDE